MEKLPLQDALRTAGLRITRPRIAVLEAIGQHPHADTPTLVQATRGLLDGVSTQTVYDCLAVLSQAGVIRRIEPGGLLPRFELRTGDNHHHLVCRVCGAIADVDCAVGQRPCLTASEDHGYLIDEAEVIYWGTCPACAKSPNPNERK